MARPAEFDRAAVLGQATEAFWRNGYCATSVSQLVAATALQPGSLYAAFESKEGLFLAALDHYADASLARVQRTIAEAPDPLQGVRRVLRSLTAGDNAKDGRGCLLVNTVLEVGRNNALIRERVRHHLGRIESALCAALEQARRQRLLAGEHSPAALAAFLMTTIWGLRVLDGTGASVAQAQQVVEQALSVLD